jgi:hypothetical protein
MNALPRILHLWRYAFLGLRLELILFHLTLLCYVVSPFVLGIRALGSMEEPLVAALMGGTVWLAGRIMLIDPLPHLRAAWRVMPWTTREMAWGRVGFVMAVVFLPWLVAHAVRLLMLRPDAGVFLSAMGYPLLLWPVVALSALVAGLSRSLLAWLLTPVAAMGLMGLLALIDNHSKVFTFRFRPYHEDLPWAMNGSWVDAKCLTLSVALGALLTLGGLISLGWPSARRWALRLAPFLIVLGVVGFDRLVNLWKPRFRTLERVTSPADNGMQNAAVYDGVVGLEPSEYLNIPVIDFQVAFEGKYFPGNGSGPHELSVISGQGPSFLFGKSADEIPGAIWSSGHGKKFHAAAPDGWRGDGTFKPAPGPGLLDVKVAYDVCRMEKLADFPLEAGTTIVAMGQRMVLESITLGEQSVTASVVVESTEVAYENLLRRHEIPGELIFALVTKDGTMMRAATPNFGTITENLVQGRSMRTFGLGWPGILADPWQSGAATAWMEGCRLRIYTSVSRGLAPQHIKRVINNFP